jgi:hypothetical protein
MALMDLFRPRWRNSSPFVRRRAVEGLTDVDTLVSVIRNDEDAYVYMEAVDRLNDQAALTRIARDDGREWVKVQAIAKLADQSVLRELACNASALSVQRAAVAAVTDEAILTELARSCPNLQARLAAAIRVTEAATDATSASMSWAFVTVAQGALQALLTREDRESARVRQVEDRERKAFLTESAKWERLVVSALDHCPQPVFDSLVLATVDKATQNAMDALALVLGRYAGRSATSLLQRVTQLSLRPSRETQTFMAGTSDEYQMTFTGGVTSEHCEKLAAAELARRV